MKAKIKSVSKTARIGSSIGLCFLALVTILTYQNCSQPFAAMQSDSSSGSFDSLSSLRVVIPSSSNNYSPNQRLSFTYDKSLVPAGPVVWSNLMDSNQECQEISTNDADPYVITCSGSGELTINLLINPNTTQVAGPYITRYLITTGIPRTDFIVPFVITNANGNWNTQTGPLPAPVPLWLIKTARPQDPVLRKNVPGQITFSIDKNQFLPTITTQWSVNAPNCAVVAGKGGLSSTQFTLGCTADSNITVTLSFGGSDPTTGAFSVQPMTWTSSYSLSNDSFADYRPPGKGSSPTPKSTDASYLGIPDAEILTTNIVFVGQTIRFYNKASATKQFGLSGLPCGPTGPIPYSSSNDNSKYVDCKITAEFGDVGIGSAVTNTYDPSQKFFLIAIDGEKLYNNNCQVCHASLNVARGQIGNETLTRLRQALQGQANSTPMLQFDNSTMNHLSNLTDPQKLAIIHALQD